MHHVISSPVLRDDDTIALHDYKAEAEAYLILPIERNG